LQPKRISTLVSYHRQTMKLRGALLYVKDLKRMREFYSQLLGATPTNRDFTDVWANFEAGGAQFALHAIPAEIAKNIEIKAPPTPREGNPLKLIFEVRDVETERARVESLGAQTVRRPWQKSGEAFDAVDPEGNILSSLLPRCRLISTAKWNSGNRCCVFSSAGSRLFLAEYPTGSTNPALEPW